VAGEKENHPITSAWDIHFMVKINPGETKP
jgi:hypothetical protein